MTLQDEEDETLDELLPPPPPIRSHAVLAGYTVTPPKKPLSPPRPFSRENTLRDIETLSSCLPRNHSYMKKLRDDHQLNIKQEKELKREKRRDKREKKAQEVTEQEELVSMYSVAPMTLVSLEKHVPTRSLILCNITVE